MTSLHELMLPGRMIEPATVRILGGGASDRASRPGTKNATKQKETKKKRVKKKLIRDYETTTDKIIQTYTYNENIDYVGVTN